MNDRKIDFACLDPSGDAAKWEARVSRIVRTAARSRQIRNTLWYQLVAWTRPALAAAGVAALLCVSAAAVASYSAGEETATTQTAPAQVLASWAAGGELPSTERILQVLGDSDVQN